MAKTPSGTRISLGYKKAILCISKRRVNAKLKQILKLVTEYIGESDSSIRMETFLGSNFKQSTNRIKTTTM